jgi:hypothetical protein
MTNIITVRSKGAWELLRIDNVHLDPAVHHPALGLVVGH